MRVRLLSGDACRRTLSVIRWSLTHMTHAIGELMGDGLSTASARLVGQYKAKNAPPPYRMQDQAAIMYC